MDGYNAPVNQALSSPLALASAPPVPQSAADDSTATLVGASTYTDVFSVTGIVPASGDPCVGETVTITGVGFVAGSIEVTFGGVPETLRTDSLSAAFANRDTAAENDARTQFTDLCDHYGLTPTRNNVPVTPPRFEPILVVRHAPAWTNRQYPPMSRRRRDRPV